MHITNQLCAKPFTISGASLEKSFLSYEDTLSFSQVNKASRAFIESYELMRRVPENEQKKISERLCSLKNVEQNIRTLTERMEKGAWSAESPVFKSSNFPFYAWIAFTQGKMTRAQLVTMCLFWSMLQDYEFMEKPVSIPLFNEDGEVNSKAMALMKPTFINSKNNHVWLTDAQITQFMEGMKRLPLSERQFLYLEKISAFKQTVGHAIHELGISVFLYAHGSKQMLPSCGMMQTFLRVRYGKNAVTINPVFGLSSTDDFVLNGKFARREQAYPFPFVTLVTQADGYFAPVGHFTFHDFYHAIICSEIPQKYRLLLTLLADSLKSETDLKSLRESILDMEYADFRTDHRKGWSEDAVFWYSIAGDVGRGDINHANLGIRKLLHFLFTEGHGKGLISSEGLEEVRLKTSGLKISNILRWFKEELEQLMPSKESGKGAPSESSGGPKVFVINDKDEGCPIS